MATSTASANYDRLGVASEGTFTTNWDWKGEYMSKLSDDSLERFSQFSATPDTTAMFAGPARFNALSGSSSASNLLTPIGLVDGIQMSQAPQLAQLYEIGSNRSFFTRGKTAHSITFSKMLADQKNILTALSQHSYRPDMNDDGVKSGDSDIALNLDSERFSVPFGLLLVFKTRGGNGGDGKILAATYLEYCMFANYSFAVSSGSPVIAENIAIQYDRPIPVAFS